MALKANHEISFTDLKATLEVTDGNLDAHLKKLAAAGYLHTRFPSEGRMRTLFSLSESGAKEVDRYLKSLRRLLNCI